MRVPQAPAGVQLQSTPPLALSLETVAAMVAVPFGAIVDGGAALMEIEMLGGGEVVPPDEDETAPQPEKPTASSRTLAITNSPHFDDTRVFSTLSHPFEIF